MTDTVAATGLTVQQWADKFFAEYLHDGGFKPLMGTGENAVIQVKEDLTKKPGDSITIALVNQLSNAAVTGTASGPIRTQQRSRCANTVCSARRVWIF